MKKLLFTLLFFGFCFIVSAQKDPQVGDTFIIKEPNAQSFQYVKFPKPNILIKRGTVDRYKSVYGDTVVIDDIITKDDGTKYVLLKKKDGTKFFGYLSSVKANYTKALEANEIAMVK